MRKIISSLLGAAVGLCSAVVVAGAGQFDTNWSCKSRITINYHEYDPLSNITVLVTLGSHIPGFSYGQFASTNGADLRFDDGSGQELAYEIDTWNPSGTSYVWVRIPLLLGNGGTNFVTGQWVYDMPWEGQPVYANYSSGILFAESPNNNGTVGFAMGEGLANVGYYSPYILMFAKVDPRQPGYAARLNTSYSDQQIFHTWTNGLYGAGVHRGRARFYTLPGVVTNDLYAERDDNDNNWQLMVYEHLMQSGCDPTNPPGYDISAKFADYDPTLCWTGNTSHWSYAKFVKDRITGPWNSTNRSAPVITAHWGNPAATQPAYTTNGGAWSSTYSGVWHLNETAARDSNKNIADGTPTSVSVAAGKLGNAVQFVNASASAINFGSSVNLGLFMNKGYAIEGWIKKTSNAGSGSDLAVAYGGGSTRQVAAVGTSGGSYKSIHVGQNHDFPRSVPMGTWQHFVVTHHANGQGDDAVNGGDSYSDLLWLDGQLMNWRGNSSDGNSPDHNSNTVLQLPATAGFLFGKGSWESATCGDMMLDEVRVYNSEILANKIRVSYLSQASNTTFMTYGAVSNQSPGNYNLVAAGSSWKYLDNGSDQGRAWRSNSFNDTAWSNGIAPLGYPTGLVSTLLGYGGNASAKYTTTYFRKTISVTNVASITGLLFSAQIDDGAIFYLNGHFVAQSSNMQFGVSNVTYATYANANADNAKPWQVFSVSPTNLIVGQNVIAVEVHQSGPSSSDIYLDFMADVVSYATTNPTPVEVTNAPAVLTDWTAYNDALYYSNETNNGTYSTNSPTFGVNGALVATNGQGLSATVSFTTNAAVALSFVQALPVLPVGTDVYNLFNGKIGVNNVSDWASGTVGMTLSGLNTGKQYSVAMFCSRSADSSAYTDRWTIVTISSVDSFVNSSSAGSVKSTSAMANDTTRLISALAQGLVARYDSVRPGSDGTIAFSLLGTGTNGQSHGYLNFFMVQEQPASAGMVDSDTDGMDDTWEQSHFGGLSQPNAGPTQDFDNDGFDNYSEYRAGTDPLSSSSRLEMMGASAPTGMPGQVVLQWGGVTGKTYTIEVRSNLATGGWSALQSGIPGGVGNAYTGSAPGSLNYWRIKVE